MFWIDYTCKAMSRHAV